MVHCLVPPAAGEERGGVGRRGVGWRGEVEERRVSVCSCVSDVKYILYIYRY